MEGRGHNNVDAARQIVKRCLAGDERAWERLYRRFHPRLRKAIELRLGSDGRDVDAVEEIASRVWYALLRDDCRLLASYDADRGTPLDAFLIGLARIETTRYVNQERGSMSKEFIRWRRALQEQRVSDWEVILMMNEFVSTLTANGKEHLEGVLAAPAETESAGDPGNLSPCALRQRRHRLRRKLKEFLDES
jgi:DNA-directed RNA polymerase specialized sigma24 family protein